MMPIPFCRAVFRLLSAAAMAITFAAPACADESATSAPWYDRVANRLESTWTDGTTELYVPLYVLHMRFAYTRE